MSLHPFFLCLGLHLSSSLSLPTVPEIFEQMAAEKKASLPSRIPPFSPNPFVDAEAIHSGDDASEDEPLDQQQDDYDYEDSFM